MDPAIISCSKFLLPPRLGSRFAVSLALETGVAPPLLLSLSLKPLGKPGDPSVSCVKLRDALTCICFAVPLLEVLTSLETLRLELLVCVSCCYCASG